MNAFTSAKTVEAKALDVLEPFIKMRSHDGRFVICDKGPLSKIIQQSMGDIIASTNRNTISTIEVKAEEKTTGNLFIETWSNRNIDDRYSHAERGSNVGWIFKQRADYLFYYFLDNDLLFIIDFFELKRWLFHVGALYRYREVRQNKQVQMNDTWGRLVKIVDIEKNVKRIKQIHPKEILIPFYDSNANVSVSQQTKEEWMSAYESGEPIPHDSEA